MRKIHLKKHLFLGRLMIKYPSQGGLRQLGTINYDHVFQAKINLVKLLSENS